MSGFRSAGYAWKLFCGEGALERDLKAMVARAGASRAFVICSPSVRQRTDLVDRIDAALGGLCAGHFAGIEKDSGYGSVCAARDAAHEAGADLLIAVGGGSVIVAVRAVAIFLAEAGDPFALMTQYPADGPAVSPRLLAPKLPIVNVPTTPTSAMNRAGTGLRNPELDQRMEYFDPKTRPGAIFLDDGALLSAPPALLLSTATTVFAGCVAGLSQAPSNPLVEGDQAQAFRLAHGAYRGLADDLGSPTRRRDLALAAFLQNRAEDDGRALVRGGPFAGDYAVSTALHLRFPHVGQGEATAVVHAPALRRAETVAPDAARRVAEGLEVWQPDMSTQAAVVAVADRLETLYRQAGMPADLRSLGIAREDLPAVAALTVKNFNARAGERDPQAQIAAARALLDAAWQAG